MVDDLPRGPDGIGYAMWIFRFKRGDRFEEIHVPRHDVPGERTAMRDRARKLADEVGGAVAWSDGVTSANTVPNHLHPGTMTPMWLVAWPRAASPTDNRSYTAWEVIECPNLKTHHRH